MTGLTLVFFHCSSALRANIFDDTGIATNRIAVNGVVNTAVADPLFLHATDDLLKGFQIVRGISVQFHISNMTAIGQGVIRSLQTDFIKSTNVIIDRNVEGVGIILPIGNPGDRAVLLSVEFNKPAGKAFGGGCNQREVQTIFCGGPDPFFDAYSR